MRITNRLPQFYLIDYIPAYKHHIFQSEIIGQIHFWAILIDLKMSKEWSIEELAFN